MRVVVHVNSVTHALIADTGNHAVAAGLGHAVGTAAGGGPGVGGDGVGDGWLAALLWCVFVGF